MLSEETQARIAQFERLGGVDLSSLDPESRSVLDGEIYSGVAHHKKAVFSFRCNLCQSVVRSDQDLEPLCTGPSWTDDHIPTPMVKA